MYKIKGMEYMCKLGRLTIPGLAWWEGGGRDHKDQENSSGQVHHPYSNALEEHHGEDDDTLFFL